MSNQKERAIDWEKRDHNKVYDDALARWEQSKDAAVVIGFLREKKWTDGEILGYLTRRLGFSLQESREALDTVTKNAP